MPKPPKAVLPPSTPTAASFISRAQGPAGMGQRPNKFVPPVTGSSFLSSIKPSLLGGI